MADHTVIGAVSATITSTLTNALSVLGPPPPPIALVHDLQGNVPTDPPTLTVFLYEIIEDASAKNRSTVRQSAPPDVLVSKPPMALILKYLITPWSNDRMTDQAMLARALQAFYDNGIIGGPQLRGGLAGSTDTLKISLSPLQLEDRTRVWHAIQKPYRLSLSYEARVVNLDSEIDRAAVPVSQRVLQPAAPENGA
jgi:hypothetical protein